tara:strand:+ start:669 stop:893 length:225 start_codon:yes stop_codon:yes gene_type:complete
MCFRIFYKKGGNILPNITNIENDYNKINENNQDINKITNIPSLDITKSSLYKRRFRNKENINNSSRKFVRVILL